MQGTALLLLIGLIAYLGDWGGTTVVRVSSRPCLVPKEYVAGCAKEGLGASFKFIFRNSTGVGALVYDDAGAPNAIPSLSSTGVLDNCKFVDSNNWECNGSGVHFTMKDGIFRASNSTLMSYSEGVTGWAYWWDVLRRLRTPTS